MQNAILRREYASVALMERGATIIMLTFRERCLAVPGKLAVFGPEVEMAARAEIYECLEELSRPILSADEPPWLDGDATDASDDAAADEEKK
jgi:hypothetical protein